MTSPANQPSATPLQEIAATPPALARVTPFPPRSAAPEPASAQAATLDEGAAGSRRKARWLVALGAVIALIAGVTAWLMTRSPAAPAAVASAAPLELAAVDVAAVEPRLLSRSLPLSGSISPVVQAMVKAKVGGEVELVAFREGQEVRAGAVLARIDTRNLQAQYDRELAAVDKARADLELATLNRDKNRTLLEQRYISQNTYEATQSAYAGSVANLKLAEAQARLARINLEDAVVRAPFPGTLARRLVQPGEHVAPDTALITLVDLRHMVLEAAVPAAEIPAVRIGQQARFTVAGFGERAFGGEVQRINPVTADGSRAITVYITVPNADQALKGGMFAQGELTLEASQPVLAVARRAVREEAGMPYVLTLRDHTITRTPVTLGARIQGNAFVEVESGLAAGEQVILTDIGAAKVGQKALVRAGGPAPGALD